MTLSRLVYGFDFHTRLQVVPGSFNGRTFAFGANYRGSSPLPGAKKGANMKKDGINWLFYAPQFHVGIAVLAAVVLGYTVAIWHKVKN